MNESGARSSQPIAENVSLEPVSPGDREFLLRVYECSREIELSMVPWDDATKRTFVEHQFDAQTSHYSSEYPEAKHYVIMLSQGGEQAGRLWVNRTESEIAILDVTVLPEFRRRGIGSSIVGSLVDEAQSTGKSVRVYVETFNPAQEFFANRDFIVESSDGINAKFVRYAKS
jgi:ribosomal protein S18 acetylase RimI-like enzyme